MNTYTAQQMADLLRPDIPEMNLRTVRYYTQLGIVPPLELSGNKRVYTDKHLAYFRAAATLTKTGETLSAVQEKLQRLSLEDVAKIGDKLAMYQPNHVLENETRQVGEDVYITVSPRISAELKQKVFDTVSRLIEGDRTDR